MDPDTVRAPPRSCGTPPTVAIACHVNPDADALGLDARASAHHLVARGTRVICSFPNEPLVGPAVGEGCCRGSTVWWIRQEFPARARR